MSTGRRGLGKGLGALLPVGESGAVQELPIEEVRPAADQPRRQMEETALEELAASIRTHGVLQPIVVRPVEDGYEVIAGERRLRAAARAGLATIPAVVREVSEAERLELALVENLQREDLNPVEEAEGYRVLVERFGYTQEQLAERVGKSRPHVANTLRLLGLSPALLQLVREGKLSAGHGRALLGLPDEAVRRQAAEELVRRGASVREAEEWVRRQLEGKRARVQRKEERDPAWEEWERRLSRNLGTKVSIRGNEKRGRLEIEYYSSEDLERLLEILHKKCFT